MGERSVGRAAHVASGEQLATLLRRLKEARGRTHQESRTEGRRRSALTAPQRGRVLAKTDGRCHICGGKIQKAWHADHVRAHSAGGDHREDNYLAAHRTCNGYRWDYSPEELQLIVKLGVWLANEIRHRTPLGRDAADSFARKEAQRRRRTRKR